MIAKTTKLHEAAHMWAARQLRVPIQKLVFEPNGVGKTTVNDFEDLKYASTEEIIQRYKDLYVISAVGLYSDIRTETTNIRSPDDDKAVDLVVTGLIQRLPLREIIEADLFRTLERMSEDLVRSNWRTIDHIAEGLSKFL